HCLRGTFRCSPQTVLLFPCSPVPILPTLSVDDGSVIVELKDSERLGTAAGEEVLFVRAESGSALNWRVSGSAGLSQKYWPEIL
ncbi:MAG: hypothetical protein AAF353_00440, partial [Pseudomonadota bacterium]